MKQSSNWGCFFIKSCSSLRMTRCAELSVTVKPRSMTLAGFIYLSQYCDIPGKQLKVGRLHCDLQFQGTYFIVMGKYDRRSRRLLVTCPKSGSGQ